MIILRSIATLQGANRLRLSDSTGQPIPQSQSLYGKGIRIRVGFSLCYNRKGKRKTLPERNRFPVPMADADGRWSN